MSKLVACKKFLRLMGAGVVSYTTDLSTLDDAIRVSNQICLNHEIDIITSNAGITNSVTEGKVESWLDSENLLSINLLGAVAVNHPVIKQMQERRSGLIAYVSSFRAYCGMPLIPAYVLAKPFMISPQSAVKK